MFWGTGEKEKKLNLFHKKKMRFKMTSFDVFICEIENFLIRGNTSKVKGEENVYLTKGYN